MIGRLRRKFRRPSDILLMLRIGCFMLVLPSRLRRTSLPRLLDEMRSRPRPKAADLASAIERIARLRSPWFRLAALRGANTCFMRAMTLYRFLEHSHGDLRIHFVVEPARRPGDRLRGHAWVTVDGEILEEPADLGREGRTSGIYTHPTVSAATT